MAIAKKRNIRRSVGFDNKEMEGYFMIANKDAALAIVSKLTGSQLRLWLYLMMIDSFADLTIDGEKVYHSIPSPQEIAIKIGASPETVEKDMRKLKKLGLYEYRITAWQGHNQSAAKAREESERLKKKKAETKSQHSEGLNKPPKGLNKPSEGLNKPLERLNKPPKRLNKPSQEAETTEKHSVSSSSQTLQTYTDFKQTLSESEGENFFNFVREKTKNLEKPINDLEAWLASKNAAKQNRWEIYYRNYQEENERESTRTPKQNPGSGNYSPSQKKRALAEFLKRMGINQPVDEPKSEAINSPELERQQAEFNQLLDNPPEKEPSLAQQRRKKIAEIKRQQEEIRRANRTAAAERAKQQTPDVEQRKIEIQRQIEEFNQNKQSQNSEIEEKNLEDE